MDEPPLPVGPQRTSPQGGATAGEGGRVSGPVSVHPDAYGAVVPGLEGGAFLEALFKTAQHAMFIKDRSRRYVAVNPAMERLFGRPSAFLLGATDEDLFDDGVQQSVSHSDQRVLAGEVVDQVVSREIGGQHRTLHVVKNPIRDADGSVYAICGVAIDITGRERAAEALRRGEETLRCLMEQSSEGIVIVDENGLIVIWNTAAEHITGIARDQALGQAIWEVQYAVSPSARRTGDLRGQIRAMSAGVLDPHNPSWPGTRTERWIERSDGIARLIQAAVFPIRTGERFFLAAILTDVTEQRQAEAIAARQNAQLEAVRRLAMEIASQLDLDKVLESIVAQAVALVDAAEGGLLLYRPESDRLEWVVAKSPNRAELEGMFVERDQGLVGTVLATRKSLIVDDYSTWENRLETARLANKGAAVGIPVCWGAEFLGVLLVAHSQPNALGPWDADILSVYAGHAAIAVRNARLLAAERKAREFSDALAKAAAVITSTLDMDTVLDRILEQVARVIDGDAVNILVVEGSQVRVVRHRGYARFGSEQAIGQMAASLHEMPLLAGMLETGQPTIVEDAASRPGWRRIPGLEWVRSMVSVPVLLSGATVGFLSADGQHPAQFDEEDARRLMAFADYCAIAINNARLFEQTQRDVDTKAILLREVNHRVKNNLAAIIGLLYAEQRYGQRDRQRSLDDLAQRIHGLGAVHGMLTATEWRPVPLDDLAQTIIHGAVNMAPSHKSVTVRVFSDCDVTVTPDQAHSLALVINELTTNSLKYALEDRPKGAISVNVAMDGEVIVFRFKDDGPGFQATVLDTGEGNVGMFLAENIVRRELGGAMRFFNDGGAVTEIRFRSRTATSHP